MKSMMKRFFSPLTIAFLSVLLLSACSTPDVSLYAKNEPKFELQDFFSGSLKAHGILKNRSGEVIRYFNATLEGDWKTVLERLPRFLLLMMAKFKIEHG
jgi:hypothetical protein